MRKIAFISGLPRSGSTLLSAILRQNPEFHADVTSPVFEMVSVLLKKFSGASEFSTAFDEDTRLRILRGVFANFYGPRWKGVVFDTNRLWCAKLPLLSQLFPGCKIIALVRPVVEIFESLERALQRQPSIPSMLVGYDPNFSVYERCDWFMKGPLSLVGGALNALKDGFFGPFNKNLMIVSYDRLVQDTQKTLDAIYSFLEEPSFKHNFSNVSFKSPDYDARLGLLGLHEVRQVVSQVTYPPVLPSDLRQKFLGAAFWQITNYHGEAVRLI